MAGVRRLSKYGSRNVQQEKGGIDIGSRLTACDRMALGAKAEAAA